MSEPVLFSVNISGLDSITNFYLKGRHSQSTFLLFDDALDRRALGIDQEHLFALAFRITLYLYVRLFSTKWSRGAVLIWSLQ